MLTELHVKNFKGWADSKAVRLAPITVFFGPNSSGKTSLLQSLLLLKQTAESSDRSRVLHTGDQQTLVDLGTLSDVMFGHDLTETLRIGFAWDLPKPLETPRGTSTGIRFTLDVQVGSDGQPHVRVARYVIAPRSTLVQLLRRDEGNQYDLEGSPGFRRSSRGRPWPLPPPVKFYGFPDEVRRYFREADWLADLALALEQQLARIHYVGPLRLYPARSVRWSGERPLDVGRLGELAVPAILAAQSDNRLLGFGCGKGRRYQPFLGVVARWLKSLGVIDSFRVEPVGRNRKEYEVRVKRSPTSAEVLITDVGVGVSQILPVVVQSFYAEPGSTVIFEQPEIHLHPRVQSEIADVLIEAAKINSVQFIVESHSEHFLRRLQRRVAEGRLSKADVALYFCEPTDGRSRIEELRVDETGSIANWPRDFFGDRLGDLSIMTEQAMKRSSES